MNLLFISISFFFFQLLTHPSFSHSLILTLSIPLSPILFLSPQHFQIYGSHTAYPWRNQPWRSKKIKIFSWITTGSFYKGVVKIILRACPCWDIYCVQKRLYWCTVVSKLLLHYRQKWLNNLIRFFSSSPFFFIIQLFVVLWIHQNCVLLW